METMTLEIAVPKNLFTMLGLSKAQAATAVKEFWVLRLYLERRISAGKAAELLDMTKREFVRLLARWRIPYFDYTDEELEDEFRVLDEWRHQHPNA